MKLFRTVSSALGALRDPSRADLVADVGELTGGFALARMRDKMAADPTGRRILQLRPRVNASSVNLTDLATLPPNAFGRVYADYMTNRGFNPDDRPQTRHIDDPELAYVMQRYREAHDFLHAVTGLGSSVEEELAQKWLEFAQTGLPMAALGGVFGPLRLRPDAALRLGTVFLPWALRVGWGGKFFLNVFWEECLGRDVDDLRRELRMTAAPLALSKNAHL
jgi:ubiquinone biosynthesis protein COQ4